MSSTTRERGHVDDHRPALLPQPEQHRQGQRQLLADVAARLVDDRQPVGVGVEHEADVGPALAAPAAGPSCRFSASGSGGCAKSPSASRRRHDRPACRATRAAPAPSGPPAPPLASSRTRKPRPRMRGTSTSSRTRSRCQSSALRHSRRLPSLSHGDAARSRPASKSCLISLPARRDEDGAVGAEQLQAVPRRGIVARGDLDAAGRVEPCGRRGRRSASARCRGRATSQPAAASPARTAWRSIAPLGRLSRRQHDAAAARGSVPSAAANASAASGVSPSPTMPRMPETLTISSLVGARHAIPLHARPPRGGGIRAASYPAACRRRAWRRLAYPEKPAQPSRSHACRADERSAKLVSVPRL